MADRCDFLVTILVLACSAFAARHAQSAAALERGTAIIEPLALRELDHGRFGLARVMLRRRDRPTRRSATASCSRCRRWRRCARRSTPNSTAIWLGTRLISPTKPSALGTSYDVQLFDRSLLYSARLALRAVRHHQPDGSRLCLAGKLRRNPADLPVDANQPAGAGPGRCFAAAADDAQCRAEGQSRSGGRRQWRHTRLRRDRAPLARSW